MTPEEIAKEIAAKYFLANNVQDTLLVKEIVSALKTYGQEREDAMREAAVIKAFKYVENYKWLKENNAAVYGQAEQACTEIGMAIRALKIEEEK